MPHVTPLDALPVWGVFVFTLILVAISVELGYLFGKRRHRRVTTEKEGPVGTMVGAALGLLAFMLAFTFGLAASRFDVRRTVMLDETNAIGTTYLRADMLAEPHRTEARALLREYVDTRLEAVRTQDLALAVKSADDILEKLWKHAVVVGKESPHAITALYISSLNETIDLHATRLMVVTRTRVPPTIWGVLYIMTILAMGAMGYHSGISETARSPAVLVVAIGFALVIGLIADLDRPAEGLIKLSQQTMVDLQTMMHNDTD